ncbi:hypothetical protein AMTR_s03452p00005800 [Amborella trichopoda]|uniref:Anaphase-promoting complex subunit 4-like WD40 domain-containing protein n=1 Tax=Amborella trichopoda TaxID=13333 RepID=U5CKR7_AMBTC|nr:hypothetical protein AMTR_s03452p00005800 [Amborella trichopoda]
MGVTKVSGLLNDYYLNLLDWSCTDILAIALRHTIYLCIPSKRRYCKLTTINEDNGLVTSINWDHRGDHIAVGLENSEVQLWDINSTKKMRTRRSGHRGRIPSLAWNSCILTTGGTDGLIINHDMRVKNSHLETYRANSSNSPLHKIEDHLAAVKALAWCPFQSNLLASGGGGADRCIKFWNTHNGACLKSVDTGYQVCSLLWSNDEEELLSSHGFSQNQLKLWEYPSMVKLAELKGHTSRVLFTAQSPDGRTVASAGADEEMRFWQVFGTSKLLTS